jgi:hypothetical protein
MIFEAGLLAKSENPRLSTIELIGLKKTAYSVSEYSGLSATGNAPVENIKAQSSRE